MPANTAEQINDLCIALRDNPEGVSEALNKISYQTHRRLLRTVWYHQWHYQYPRYYRHAEPKRKQISVKFLDTIKGLSETEIDAISMCLHCLHKHNQFSYIELVAKWG